MMPEPPFDPLPERVEPPAAADSTPVPPQPRQSRSRSETFFAFAIAIAISIGSTPVLPQGAVMRYTLTWGMLAAISVLSWLLGDMERIGQESPENLGWGLLYALLLGIPSLVLLSQVILSPAAARIFPDLGAGSLLAMLVFVMPLAETLYFRGLLQSQVPFWLVGLLGCVWNISLFFPVLGAALADLPAIAAVLTVMLLLMNLLYAYVRRRNGLAAAWICQIVANFIIFYIPF